MSQVTYEEMVLFFLQQLSKIKTTTSRGTTLGSIELTITSSFNKHCLLSALRKLGIIPLKREKCTKLIGFLSVVLIGTGLTLVLYLDPEKVLSQQTI